MPTRLLRAICLTPPPTNSDVPLPTVFSRIEWETVPPLKQLMLPPQKLVFGEELLNYFFRLNNLIGCMFVPFASIWNHFSPPPPPDLNSRAYREAVKEVKLWGKKDSPLRTQEQTLIAKFWKDFGYSSTPPGHWNEIAQIIASQKKLNSNQRGPPIALLNLAMTDAGITAWKAKFKYHLWRPIDAIRNANQVPSTVKLWDRSWKPLLESPPHPEYISGHACYSGAASTILSEYFAKEKTRFVAQSDSIPDERRIFSSFTTCAEEIANSRLWGDSLLVLQQKRFDMW